MSSPFKDGIDAGLSDFKSYNSDLGNVSLGTDSDGFSNVVSFAGRASNFISRMRSGFERIGENLHGDPKSWAENQRQRLLNNCSALLTAGETLKTRANEGLEAAKKAKDLRDAASDDDDKKSQLNDAEQRLKEASDKLREQINDVRGRLNAFYDELKDVNTNFKNAIGLAKNGVDGNQSQVNQVLNDMRSLEDQARSKIADERNLWNQVQSQQRSVNDLSTKIEDKRSAEQNADRALVEGVNKEPPISDSDLQSLVQASRSAWQDRETAEADRDNYLSQTLRPTEEAWLAKYAEVKPLEQQLKGLKERRDTLMDGLNKARRALTELNLEYQEPSL